jgi:hypothetical protein
MKIDFILIKSADIESGGKRKAMSDDKIRVHRELQKESDEEDKM